MRLWGAVSAGEEAGSAESDTAEFAVYGAGVGVGD